jgi:hypothetical protein
VQFEASSDGGATWVAISGTPLNSSTAVSSATTANTWKFNVASLTDIRARCSAWTSAPTVVIRSSKAVANAIGMAKVYLLLLVLCGFAQADQVNCIKWKDANGTVIGTYCRPFTVVAGNGIALSDNHAGAITISTDGAPAAGAGGSDTQINFNSSGSSCGKFRADVEQLDSTLTATHITGLDNKPFIDMVRDCALVGDGVTDDAAAANACFLAHPGWAFYFPPTQAVGSCSYKFNATLYPQGQGSLIMGGGGGFKAGDTGGGTLLCFAAGVSGIWLDMTPNSTSGITIENMSLLGSEGVVNLTSPTKLNLPADLPQFTRSIATAQRTANVLTVTITSKGNEGLTQQVGATVKISGTSDATVNGECVISTLTGLNTFSENATGFTCAQNGADTGAFGSRWDGRSADHWSFNRRRHPRLLQLQHHPQRSGNGFWATRDQCGHAIGAWVYDALLR